MHSRITLLLQSQPFSLGLCLADFHGGGFVQQSLLVELNVAGIEPQNLIKTKIRLFVLTE